MSALMILKLPNVTVLDDEVYICSSSRKVTALSSKTTPPIKQKIKPKTSTDINLRLLNVPSAQMQIETKVKDSPAVKKTKTFSPKKKESSIRKVTKEHSDKEASNDNGYDISDVSDLDLYQNEEESFSSCDI